MRRPPPVSVSRSRASPRPARAATARVARQLDGLAGGLEPPASAADSIAAAVGVDNGEHFLVGTQDAALRERLRRVPGCPQLFVAAAGVSLELPTEAQRLEAGGRGVVPEHERRALALEPGAGMEVHTNVRFKRNKAKGPNPLSAKKRKAGAPAAAPAGTEVSRCARHIAEIASDTPLQDGRQRKRQRRKREPVAAAQ